MASPTVFDAFTERLADWETTLVVFENEQIPSGRTPFVYVEIFGDAFDQDTMGAPGSNVWEETGQTYLHVMVPSGSGSATARDHANALMYLFREQPIDGINMTEMSIGAGDPGRDFPNMWALTLTIFWRRFDITSIPTP